NLGVRLFLSKKTWEGKNETWWSFLQRPGGRTGLRSITSFAKVSHGFVWDFIRQEIPRRRDSIRRRRSLISAQGSNQNPGITNEYGLNPEKGSATDKPCQGFNVFYIANPGLSLRSNPGLKLA